MSKEACIQAYGLLPSPAGMKPDNSSEEVWAAYLLERGGDKAVDHEDEDGDEEDEEVEDLKGKEIKSNILSALTGVGEELKNAISRNTMIYVSNLTCDDGLDDIRDITICSRLWSPRAIPCAIEVRMTMHQRTRYHSYEFYFDMKYRLIKGANKKGDRRRGKESEDYLLFASSCLVDPPALGNEYIDTELWGAVSEEKQNIYPKTVNRLYKHYFGGKDGGITSYQFLDLLLCAAGCRIKGVSIGWECPYAGISWVEYACRSATNALESRHLEYYEPYDVAGAKLAWAQRVIEYIYDFVEEYEDQRLGDEDDGMEHDDNDEEQHGDSKEGDKEEHEWAWMLKVDAGDLWDRAKEEEMGNTNVRRLAQMLAKIVAPLRTADTG